MTDNTTGGVERYAAAERTDPFAYARAMTHTRLGIGGYNAERYLEERKIVAGDRTLVAVIPMYRNVTRP